MKLVSRKIFTDLQLFISHAVHPCEDPFTITPTKIYNTTYMGDLSSLSAILLLGSIRKSPGVSENNRPRRSAQQFTGEENDFETNSFL